MTLTEVLAICVALAALAGGITVVVKALRLMKKGSDVLDDWQGEPARPGVPERPGVMKRLATIEAELHPNHGSTMRDALDLVASGVTRLEERFEEHLQQQED